MDLDALTAVARASASRAAQRSGVRIRALDSTASSFACESFLSEVWQTGPDRPPIAADVIKAMADAGSYVAGAVDGTTPHGATPGKAGEEQQLLGACIGLWGPPVHPEMHSHIAGVHASAVGRGVGHALKLDQRAHVLEQGGQEITWTFDPLVARNAHFNLDKLGGAADEYLVNHYGQLADGINGDDDSDRILLRWDLLGERARAACDDDVRPDRAPATPRALLDIDGDRPVPRTVTDATVLITLPPDIESLRAAQPAVGRDWRHAVRDTLGALLADGARVVGFDRSACGYVVEREVR
jgi:predicted GNAT superfamily acetyltransferase